MTAGAGGSAASARSVASQQQQQQNHHRGHATVDDEMRPDSPSLPSHPHQYQLSSGSIDAAVTGGSAAATTEAGAEESHQQQQPRDAVVSGVSALSERERTHLRNVSQASDVSGSSGPRGGAFGGAVSPPIGEAPEEQEESVGSSSAGGGGGVGGAVAPDHASVRSGQGVGLGLQSTNNSNTAGGGAVGGRRSVFRESRDDLGEQQDPQGGAETSAGDADSLRRR